jgi:hypothetical protein
MRPRSSKSCGDDLSKRASRDSVGSANQSAVKHLEILGSVKRSRKM